MDLTAKSSPEETEVARETVAVEPRPMIGPLFRSILERGEHTRNEEEKSARSMGFSQADLAI